MTRSIKKTFLVGIFAILLLTLCVLCLPTTAFAAEATTPAAEEATVLYSGACGTNLTWQIDDTGTLTIDGTGLWKPIPMVLHRGTHTELKSLK